MTRNLKTLGLALAAVVALSATTASAASAQGKLTSDGPVTLIGTQTGAELENSLTALGQKVTCKEATYTAHKYNVTPHEAIPSGASKITVTPSYGLCHLNVSPLLVTVDMNGCDYVLELGETTGVDEYATNAKVRCTESKHIKLAIFTNATFHSENRPLCNVTITEKTEGYVGLRVKDTTNDRIDIAGAIEGIAVDRTPNAADLGVLCPEIAEGTAVLHIDMTVKDKNETFLTLSDQEELAG